MALEKYVSIASLGLFIMFSAEIITIYHYMLNTPESIFIALEPDPKIMQFISIGVAPAIVLAIVSFVLGRRTLTKPVGQIITAGGIILLVGMAYTYTLVDDLHETYIVPVVQLTPLLFMGVSIPIILLGIRFLTFKKPKQKKDYYF